MLQEYPIKNALDIHLVRQITGFNEVIKAQLAALEDGGSRVIDDWAEVS